ncbi:MAG: TRAFs-binding domain-containing protein [Dehalococcoidia bacterium]
MNKLAPKPLLFVAMPFGTKRDPAERYEIDFDAVYEKAIKPAAHDCDLEVIRADEEVVGGFVHTAMYERLLLAEIVLADLTLANPNVFYELGVRHAARPRSTVLMFAKRASGRQLPFDLAPIRAIPYELLDGVMSDEEVVRLESELKQRLQIAREDREVQDSPIFQLIKGYPGISLAHDVTESFRDRVGFVGDIRGRLKEVRAQKDVDSAKALVSDVKQVVLESKDTSPELLIDLMITYRDLEAWNEMISLTEACPTEIKNLITVQEQLSLALNRRNENGDRDRAREILQAVIRENAPSSETYGILGRVYKDEFEEALRAGQQNRARAALDEAIEAYKTGFEVDPRDYYPGVNLATLLLRKGTPEALKELEQVRPVVSFAVTRRGGIQSADYWDVVTVLELSAMGEDWQTAKRAAGKAVLIADAPWTLRTTARNLRIIKDSFDQRNKSTTELRQLITELENAADEMRS